MTSNFRIIENCEGYYERSEVSNSELSSLESELSGKDPIVGGDKESAYRFGSLYDAILTETFRVDFNKRTVDGIEAIPEEWDKAIKMRRSFMENKFCMDILKFCDTQVVTVADVHLEYQGVPYMLPMRCKWDFYSPDISADLKSTIASSQAQFENVCERFNYDRQCAVYMTIAGVDRMALLGVSKKNHQVFMKFVTKGDKFYNQGMEKFLELSYKYYLLFG